MYTSSRLENCGNALKQEARTKYLCFQCRCLNPIWECREWIHVYSQKEGDISKLLFCICWLYFQNDTMLSLLKNITITTYLYSPAFLKNSKGFHLRLFILAEIFWLLWGEKTEENFLLATGWRAQTAAAVGRDAKTGSGRQSPPRRRAQAPRGGADKARGRTKGYGHLNVHICSILNKLYTFSECSHFFYIEQV